jgi:hypothetical protein
MMGKSNNTIKNGEWKMEVPKGMGDTGWGNVWPQQHFNKFMDNFSCFFFFCPTSTYAENPIYSGVQLDAFSR